MKMAKIKKKAINMKEKIPYLFQLSCLEIEIYLFHERQIPIVPGSEREP